MHRSWCYFKVRLSEFKRSCTLTKLIIIIVIIVIVILSSSSSWHSCHPRHRHPRHRHPRHHHRNIDIVIVIIIVVVILIIRDGPPPCARDHRAVVLLCSHLARRWAALERHSAWSVVDAQVKACSRETHSPSGASKIYGHKAFQITHIHTTVINSGRATLLSTAHTVGLCCIASLSAGCGYNPGWCRSHPTISEMTWNMLSETLNHTVPILLSCRYAQTGSISAVSPSALLEPAWFLITIFVTFCCKLIWSARR